MSGIKATDTKSLPPIELTDNAITVLEKRYLKRDKDGTPTETPVELFIRVANNIASADKQYDASDEEVKEIAKEFYSMMTNLDFLPNSPTLMNAGHELQQLSACFVLPVEDSMESIFEAVKDAALIHKSGGGTGFSFSRLRPSGDFVLTTKGVSSGPISFMKVFNAATEAVKQGGTRRGANMGILRVDHPDILEFIDSKKECGELQNFNISVALTEKFMQAVDDDESFALKNPRSGKEMGRLQAKAVFDKIVNLAWETGDPGIIFIDRMNRDNPTPSLGDIESTNPCGEQPLLPYEACNLGSINLSNMIIENEDGSEIDWEKLKSIVVSAVHFLDNVIDVNRYPMQKINDLAKGNRKIGLGIMGWADMLIKLNIPYNSEKGVELGSKLMSFINEEGNAASSALASKRGVFPNFDQSVFNTPDGQRVRNATVTTIAPTGTLSILADCSSGIEPLFALSFIRNVLDNEKLVEVNDLFEERAKKNGYYSDELMKSIAEIGSAAGMEEVSKIDRESFVTAHDIAPEWHIKMQAAFQNHTDNAVSKTVNFSHDATTKDVEDVYRLASELGCKGVTIYRDGSKDNQVLNIGKEKVKEEFPYAPPGGIDPRPRPDSTFGKTQKIITGCGNVYVTINEDEHGLCEVFTQIGKSGGCAASQSEAIGRLISLSLRAGVKNDAIIKHLRGIRCSSPARQKGGQVLSCADAIAIAMQKYLEDRPKFDASTTADVGGGKNIADDSLVYQIGACPDCGGAIEHESGCLVCRLCGFSKCG